MQGSDVDEADRWFGMFRFVGEEVLGEHRHRAVRRACGRRVRDTAVLTALVMGVLGLAIWGDTSDFGYVLTCVLAGSVGPLVSSLRLLRNLLRVQPTDVVDLYEGRVPAIQAFRDDVTNGLISRRHVGTVRSHRLTVHAETGLLLEVDGAPTAPFSGKVVATAPIGDRVAEGSVAVGDRRPLNHTELAELDAIISRSTSRPFALAAAYATLVTLVAALVVFYLAEGLSGRGWWFTPVAFVSTFACAWLLLKKSAEGLRARAAADRAGGLVRGTTTWRLPVLDLIWERDGLPGYERLERGGLDDGARSAMRPQTF